jgi:hypothetical protein
MTRLDLPQDNAPRSEQDLAAEIEAIQRRLADLHVQLAARKAVAPPRAESQEDGPEGS